MVMFGRTKLFEKSLLLICSALAALLMVGSDIVMAGEVGASHTKSGVSSNVTLPKSSKDLPRFLFGEWVVFSEYGVAGEDEKLRQEFGWKSPNVIGKKIYFSKESVKYSPPFLESGDELCNIDPSYSLRFTKLHQNAIPDQTTLNFNFPSHDDEGRGPVKENQVAMIHVKVGCKKNSVATEWYFQLTSGGYLAYFLDGGFYFLKKVK